MRTWLDGLEVSPRTPTSPNAFGLPSKKSTLASSQFFLLLCLPKNKKSKARTALSWSLRAATASCLPRSHQDMIPFPLTNAAGNDRNILNFNTKNKNIFCIKIENDMNGSSPPLPGLFMGIASRSLSIFSVGKKGYSTMSDRCGHSRNRARPNRQGIIAQDSYSGDGTDK